MGMMEFRFAEEESADQYVVRLSCIDPRLCWHACDFLFVNYTFFHVTVLILTKLLFLNRLSNGISV